MGPPRLRRYEPDILEDEVGEGRILQRYIDAYNAFLKAVMLDRGLPSFAISCSLRIQ